MRVVGFDPGTNNFAYSAVEINERNFSYKILEHGMLGCAVKEMKGLDVGKRLHKFASEIRGLKQDYKPDFCIAERFMTRGRGGGSTIEAISLMLGVIGMVFGKEVAFIPAASWKNAWNKYHDLDQFYETLKPYGVQTHRIDAVSIGLYGASLKLEIPHFSMLSDINTLKKRLIQTR